MQTHSRRYLICVGIAALALTWNSHSLLEAGNWPQWRGPTGNGICLEQGVPIVWDRTQNVSWKVDLPGPAGATPVVWDDRIFVSTTDGDKLMLLCIDTSGGELWRRTVGVGNRTVRRDEGNSASPSPVTDGKHVWIMMASGAIACYDIDGNEVWKFNLQDRYGEFNIQFGMTSTPVLFEDRLLLQLIHGEMNFKPGVGLLVALDKLTGEGLWKQERETGATMENKHSYASPIIYSDDARQFVITHGSDYVIAHRISDGREIWRCGGLNPHNDPKVRYHPTLRFVASPVAVPGLIVVPTAKRKSVVALRPDFEGDITDNAKAHVWTLPRNTPDVPSPLVHNGLVYLCRENGNLMTLDAQTGELLYEKRTHRQRHRASPVYADGHVYLTARDGKVTVVKAGGEFEIVAQNDLEEPITASPVFSNGTLYLRSFNTLWAIRNE